jgi:hypothetical protein
VLLAAQMRVKTAIGPQRWRDGTQHEALSCVIKLAVWIEVLKMRVRLNLPDATPDQEILALALSRMLRPTV